MTLTLDEYNSITVREWDAHLERLIPDDMVRITCHECGWYTGNEGMVVIHPECDPRILVMTAYTSDDFPGSFFEPCDVCNKFGVIPEGFVQTRWRKDKQ